MEGGRDGGRDGGREGSIFGYPWIISASANLHASPGLAS